MKQILFNTDMVRAILDGRKTVTRRIIKPQPTGRPYPLVNDSCWPGYFGIKGELLVIKPPCQTGDVLWVRETWGYAADLFGQFEGVIYRADYTDADLADAKVKHFNWRPSIHMPKEAVRLFLRVKAVRAERLQEITDEQIRREGITPQRPKGMPGSECKCSSYEEGCMDEPCPNRDAYEHLCHYHPFMKLWDSTIKKNELPHYGWSANPWVWVIEFERISKSETEKGGEP
jgi:hypothetical protein